jgi:signal transduction histidine kinase
MSSSAATTPRPTAATDDGVRQAPAWRRPGPRGLLVDGGMGLVLAVLLIANGVLVLQLSEVHGLEPPGWVSFASGTVMCLALGLRRVYPIVVFVVVSVLFTIYGFNQGYDALGSSIALFLATVAVGSHGRPRARDWARGIVIAGLFGTIFYAFYVADQEGMPGLAIWLGPVYSVVLNVFYFGAAWVLGDQIRLRHQREMDVSRRTAELATRTLELEAERERSAERATIAERLRIARELHDVLGHHVSVMGVQAGAARRILDRDHTRAADALSAIEGSSRQAVTELQRVLKLLREPGDADRGPLGALGRLEDLADEVRRAGLAVTLQVDELPRLPTDVDLAAVRVVQESLTNSLRHAGPGSSVWVKVRIRSDAVGLEITDDGRGDPVIDHRRDGDLGTGLRGMRERVELHGGTFAAGPTAPRGWRVTARIPFGSEPAAVAAGATVASDRGRPTAGSNVADGMGP